MKCPNPKCGIDNVYGAKYCKKCGSPLRADLCKPGVQKTFSGQENGKKKKGSLAEQMKSVKSKLPQFARPKINISKKKLFGAVAVIVVVAASGIIVRNAGRTIHLDEYLTIETKGYDGYGKATASIDWQAIKSKYGSKLSFTKTAREEYGRSLRDMKPLEFLQEEIEVSLEDSKGLSNGDVVAYTWKVDDDLSRYVGCKFKYKDGTCEISDLEEPGKFDAFADLTVEFTGIEPHGKVNLTYTGEELSKSSFNCSQEQDLSNGDVITIGINDSTIDILAEREGKLPAESEKKYTVSGLESMLSKLEDIDDETLEKMKQQGFDEYNAMVARDWYDEGQSLEEIHYLGMYLLTPKDIDAKKNSLYLIYKVQVHNTSIEDGQMYDQVNDIYWYTQYSNLLLGADSKLEVDVTQYNTPRYNHSITIDSGVPAGWGSKKWYYDGYNTLDDLYKDVVTANLDDFNYEDGVDKSETSETAVANTVTKEEEPETETREYILPTSNTERLTKADIEKLSAEERKIALNEIYARHGRRFKDADLQAHFDACSWYKGTVAPEDFKESGLSEIETANRDLLVQYREEMGER